MAHYKLTLTEPDGTVAFEAELHRGLVALQGCDGLADWLIAEYRAWFEGYEQECKERRQRNQH